MPRLRKAGWLSQRVGPEPVSTLLKDEVLLLALGGTIIPVPSLPCQGHPCKPSPSLWQGWHEPSFRVCSRSCPGPCRNRPGAVGQRGTNRLRQPGVQGVACGPEPALSPVDQDSAWGHPPHLVGCLLALTDLRPCPGEASVTCFEGACHCACSAPHQGPPKALPFRPAVRRRQPPRERSRQWRLGAGLSSLAPPCALTTAYCKALTQRKSSKKGHLSRFTPFYSLKYNREANGGGNGTQQRSAPTVGSRSVGCRGRDGVCDWS